MDHPGDERWLDFARNLVDDREATEMRRHLDGCQKCQQVLELWRNVLEHADRSFGPEPSDDTLRFVKGAFGLKRRQENHHRVRVAQLVFDSFRTPIMEGVRAADATSRHLVHKAGPWLVDLELKRAGADHVSVAGQLMHSRRPDTRVGNFGVLLVRGRQVIAHAVANSFGEFRFGIAEESELQLLLELPAQQTVSIKFPVPMLRT